MYVYCWGPDWIVATTPEDALEVVGEYSGVPWGEIETLAEIEKPYALEDAAPITINFDDDSDVPEGVPEEYKQRDPDGGGYVTVEMAAALWVQANGRGLLCSTNW